ncbi:MAG: tRNA adenosine(34) deaminase TadA [Isosphaeraceae bacterium]
MPESSPTESLDMVMMRRALDLARSALSAGEIPVGALVVSGGQVIASAFNRRESTHDPTSHAERLALTMAGAALGRWRLQGCTLYVTLEPCIMCAGAIVLSRIDRVVYGATDPKAGACESLYRVTSDRRLNHRVALTGGVLRTECASLLSEFFGQRRRESLLDSD